MKNKPSPGLLAALALVSAIGIAQQVVLVRIFSIGQWYHFAYLIISIAMLGIALAGSLAALLGDRLLARPHRWFDLLCAGLPPGLWGSYELTQRIPFEGLEIVAESQQWLYAGLIYFLLAVPFFFVAGFVTLAFMNWQEESGLIYGVNLASSGAGAFIITLGMYYFDPVTLVYFLIGAGIIAGVMRVYRRKYWLYFYSLLAVLLLLQLTLAGPTGVFVSRYKPISYALQEPEVNHVARAVDPLARVDVLSSPRFRETPGQLSGYPYSEYGPLPEQRGLFFDGAGPEPVHRFTGDTSSFKFLDYVPTAAGFRLANSNSLLLLGAGGGTGILEGIYRDYDTISAVEASPSVKRLLAEELYQFSGQIVDHPAVDWKHEVPRRYVTSAREYSHVYLPLAEGYPGAGAGTELLNENYRLTTEAVEKYLSVLGEEGVLTIPTWVREPPRDLIRLTATVLRAGRRRGIDKPPQHLAVLRSWNVGVVIFTANPLEGEQLEKLEEFAAGRGFDLDYHPGLSPGESPRFVQTSDPTHSRLIFELKEQPEQFFAAYGYDVRPTGDDRPYFHQFFRPGRLWELLREFDFERYPHTEWGFLLVTVTLVQSLLGGAVLVFVPLLKKSVRKVALEVPVAGLYFAALGFGYMAVEVALIQRFMLLLHYPVYSVAVILSGLLVFSGVGSYCSKKIVAPRKRIQLAIPGVVILLLLLQPTINYLATVPLLQTDFLALPVVLLLIFPLGFCMGIPFPAGLRLVGERTGGESVAWAWAVNGATSVTGAVLAGLVALLWGYTVLFLFGGILYLFAAICAKII